MLTFLVDKNTIKITGVSIFCERAKDLKSNLLVVVVLVLESKGLKNMSVRGRNGALIWIRLPI